MKASWGSRGAWLLLLTLVVPTARVSAQEDAAATTSAASSEGETAPPPMTDEERAAEARRLFAAGVTATEEHELGVAEERFRAALALRDAPSIRYNLASVLFERGRYPEADVHARAAAADTTASPDIHEHATALVGQIAAAAAFVHLDVIASGDVSVTVDGWAVPDLSAEIPVAPGSHEVIATSGSVEISREAFELAAGEHRTVAVDAMGPETAVDEEIVEEEASGPPRPLVEEPLLWVGVGAGVIILTAVIVGVAVGTSGTESPVQGNFMPGVLQW